MKRAPLGPLGRAPWTKLGLATWGQVWEVLAEAAAAEATLKELLTTSPLPEWPDVPRVEAFLLRAYRERWGWEPA